MLVGTVHPRLDLACLFSHYSSKFEFLSRHRSQNLTPRSHWV